MMEASKYQLVPRPEITSCFACGAVFNGTSELDPVGLQFVAFLNGNVDQHEQVPAGLIQSVDHHAGGSVYHARAAGDMKDAWGRGHVTVVIDNPQLCAGCLAQAGGHIGLEDGRPLRVKISEQDRELAESEATVAAREARIRELEDAVRSLRRKITIQSVREKPAKPAKPAKAAA